MNSTQTDIHFVNQLTYLFVLSMEGLITESQNEYLKKALAENADARTCYYEFIASYVALNSVETFSGIAHSSSVYLDREFWSELAAAERNSPAICLPKAPKETPAPAAVPGKDVRKLSRLSLVSLITSIAAIVFIVLFARFVPVTERLLVGKLSSDIGAKWEIASGQILPGCDLYAGPLKLTEGFAEIAMDGGAVVVIQAPSQFALESPHQILLQQGKLVVKIRGSSENPFVVRSPHASIVDYGTEFGVGVDVSGSTVTYVYQGKVELRSGSNPLRFERSMTLSQNQGGHADSQLGLSKRDGISSHFVRPEEFDARLKAAKGSAYHRWLAYSLRLRRDRDVVAYYTFEKEASEPDCLFNKAESAFDSLNGELCSAENESAPGWTQDRWPQKTALAFDRSQGQYISVASDSRLSINGPITLAAWIYCADDNDGGHIVSNRLPRSFCNYQLGYRSPSLTVPDWSEGIHLARKSGADDQKNHICSRPLPEASGWTLVAATHDNETLTFYLNGTMVESKQWPRKQELVEAGLRIGSDYASDDAYRFNGKIGEIIIAKRVFTEEEIAEMYQAGKP